MRVVGRGILAAFFIAVGTLHFLNPGPFLEIVPSYLPFPLGLVYLSGFFEIAGGLGLLVPRLRWWAGMGLILLLAAVLPANIYMLTDHPFLLGQRVSDWVLWVRLPMQGVLMAMIWWVAVRPSSER